MKKQMMTLAGVLAVSSICLLGTGCSDASVASNNLARAGDQFELNRRVVFYNGITGEYILSIEGRLSIENLGNKVSILCKTGDGEYKKHSMGLADNVTYFYEQLSPAKVDVYHYRVNFKPKAIAPDIDLIN